MSRWKMTRNIAVSDKLQIPSSKLQRITKLQAPKNYQAPRSKTGLRAIGPGICFWVLGFEIWNFSGAWRLVFGVWCLVFRSAAAQKLVPFVGPDAIEPFARAAGRSRPAEFRVRDDR